MSDIEHEIALICECSGDKAMEIIGLVREHDAKFNFEIRSDERARFKAEVVEAVLCAISKMPERNQRHFSIINPIIEAIKGL